MKLDRGDYVGDITPHANFGISIPKGGGCTYVWNCHHPCLFLHPRSFFISCAPLEVAPFDRFSCFMAQKTCFCDGYVLFGCEQKNNNFHYFSPKKTQNSLGFSEMADRMVWPPSLSRDDNTVIITSTFSGHLNETKSGKRAKTRDILASRAKLFSGMSQPLKTGTVPENARRTITLWSL